jgi:hypothetical protein
VDRKNFFETKESFDVVAFAKVNVGKFKPSFVVFLVYFYELVKN